MSARARRRGPPDHPVLAVRGRQVDAVAPAARVRSGGALLDLGDHPPAARRASRRGATTSSRAAASSRRWSQAGEMLEHAEVFGNLYGTPRAPVEAAIARRAATCSSTSTGRAASRSATRACATRSCRSSSCRRRSPSSRAGCARAARIRPEVVAERMAKSRDEISHWAEYDYVLINENLPQCEAELRAIIRPSGCAATAGRSWSGSVRRLNRGIRGAADMSLYALDGVAPELPADGTLGRAGRAADRPGACSRPAPRSGSTRCCAATTSRS